MWSEVTHTSPCIQTVHFYHLSSRCVAVGGQACAAIYPLPYYIPLEERLEGDTFIEVTAIASEVDRFCGNAFLILACSYLYPACNPERGMC